MTANVSETTLGYDDLMSGPDNLSKIDRLRARDGGRCWLCDGPIDFKADPGTANAPTKEHVLSQCHDGPDRLENLVLCHRRCNQELNNLPVAEKVKLRDKRREETWKSAMRKQIGKLLIP